MPFPRIVARANRYWANPLLGIVAGHIGPLARLEHVGRRSGRVRRLPVMMFRHGDSAVIALTYGTHADWVRNVVAAGECRATLRGERLLLTDVRIETGTPDMFDVPRAVQLYLRLLRVRHLLRATVQPG